MRYPRDVALALAAGPARGLQALPVLGSLLLAGHFGATLRPGHEPLISHYTREAGVRSLTSTPPTLEELFLRHYQDDITRTGTESRTGTDTDTEEAIAR